MSSYKPPWPELQNRKISPVGRKAYLARQIVLDDRVFVFMLPGARTELNDVLTRLSDETNTHLKD
jgi:hypothetical protein